MFPIWLKNGKTPPPKSKVFFEIAANGVFLHKEMLFWNAVVPVDGIEYLEKEEPSIELFLPPIPEELTRAIVHFFAWVCAKYATEAVILLWIRENDKIYRVSVPPQSVSRAYAKYEIPDRNAGEVLVGTFHSHAGMDAFHSETDRCDEKSIDGIHGTIGRLSSDKRFPSCDVSLQAVVNGTRFVLEPTEWMKGLRKVSVESGSGHSDLAKPKPIDGEEKHGRFRLFNPTVLRSFFPPKNVAYALSGEEVLLPVDYQPPQDWADNVKPPLLSTLMRPFQENQGAQTVQDLSGSAVQAQESQLIERKGFWKYLKIITGLKQKLMKKFARRTSEGGL